MKPIKQIIKFLIQPSTRAKYFRERKVRAAQHAELATLNPNASRLVIFLVPGANGLTGTEDISGGIISINSLCLESKALKGVHGAEVLLCSYPGEPLLLRYSTFESDNTIFTLEDVLERFTTDLIMIHIPEMYAADFLRKMNSGQLSFIRRPELLHVNLLNQSIHLMPQQAVIDELKTKAGKLTITTAHQQYCNERYFEQYNVPLHKLSVWISPEQYVFKTFAEKQDLLVYSPDPHETKQTVLKSLGGHSVREVREIRNLSYGQFKQLVSEAKWSLTFGEGLDGYFIEPVFSGAISFAVYNKDFFTPDFEGLPTLLHSYEDLADLLPELIEELGQPEKYVAVQKQLFDICAKYYSKDQYRQNLLNFYNEQYSYGR